MTPGQISRRVVVDRIGRIETTLSDIRALSLDDEQMFRADPRNVAAAESYLRRALEALLDLGRHVLAKGFGRGVSEYKEIAQRSRELGVLLPQEADLLEQMAGYRNRMVHFYHEISEEELYQICTRRLDDIEQTVQAFKRWIRTHPEQIDETL
jgi:uncharacterized protein YutE (UPF0331/DUF86 family)